MRKGSEKKGIAGGELLSSSVQYGEPRARESSDEEGTSERKRDSAMPYESAPPFIIIVGAFCAMGGLQYLGNQIIYGKPKVGSVETR